MINDITVVIPTYWTRAISSLQNPDDLIFDHPTPLDGEDTLNRSLECFISMKNRNFQIVVITAPVHDEINEPVRKRVEELIAPFRKYFPIFQLSYKELDSIQAVIRESGLSDKFINLKGYPNIRNLQLLAGAILGSRYIVAIDDDEVVVDDFLDKAIEFVGEEYCGDSVDGKAGIYYDAKGRFYVDEPLGSREATNLFARKSVLQNQAYDLFMAEENRLADTTVTLGGNMVFTPALYRQISFDPFITRGEDIDYLINSMLQGYTWKIDKALFVDHFPPPAVEQFKMQEDIIRFIYEREKIKLAAFEDGFSTFSPQKLSPYPGRFLQEDLEEHALEALNERDDSLKEGIYYLSSEAVFQEAERRIQNIGHYFSFARQWPEIVRAIERHPSLQALFST